MPKLYKLLRGELETWRWQEDIELNHNHIHQLLNVLNLAEMPSLGRFHLSSSPGTKIFKYQKAIGTYLPLGFQIREYVKKTARKEVKEGVRKIV